MTTKTFAGTTTTLIFASAGALLGSVQAGAAADRVQSLTYTQDPVSGYVEAYGSIGQETFGSGSSTDAITGIGGAGRLNWWLSPTHTLQVDATGTGVGFSGSETDQAFGLAAHYAWRAMPTGNLAVMGSIGQEGTERYTTLAIEGQLHGMNWTLYGQGGVTRPVITGPGNIPYVLVQGRYYFNQNFAAIADVTLASAFSQAFSQFGAGLEFKPMGMPFSIFGRGQIATSSSGSSKDTASEAIFGVKLFAGPQAQTIWMNDVNGATYVDGNPVYGEFSRALARDSSSAAIRKGRPGTRPGGLSRLVSR